MAQLAIACLGPVREFHDHARGALLGPAGGRRDARHLRDLRPRHAAAAVAVLPAALFWGASFPLALAAAGRGQRDTGRLVGQVYAANTLGAILGSLGHQRACWCPGSARNTTQQVLVLASGWRRRLRLRGANARAQRRRQARAGMFAPLAVAVVARCLVVVPPSGLFGRSLQPQLWDSIYDHVFQREGRTATVVVQQHTTSHFRFLCIGGKVEASNYHARPPLPAAARPFAGAGASSTEEDAHRRPGHRHDGRLLCRSIPRSRTSRSARSSRRSARRRGAIFAVENNRVLEDPRTTIHYDDARHFLATTDEKFDIITSDPINSWIHGTAALYSMEYFDLCKQHLNPGGVVVQWIPLYEKDLATAKCELGTFLEAFPHATLWTSWRIERRTRLRHDIIAVGQIEPTTLDLAETRAPDRRERERSRRSSTK